MMNLRRSLVALLAACAAVVVTTLALTVLIVGTPPAWPQGSATASQSSALGATRPPEVTPSNGIGGVLAVSGDRAETFVLDREIIDDRYALAGDAGGVVFEGSPAMVSRIQFDGMEFYLDPGDCEYALGERDESSGLAPLDLSCVEIGDIRNTAVLTVEGTLRLPADQLGLRGDLPSTGGDVLIGDETLTFNEAALDLRRPNLLETGRGSYSRNPPIYPVVLFAENGALEFEYDSNAQHLRLVQVDLKGVDGWVEDGGCTLATRELGQVSPRVTVVAMTLECAEVDLEGVGLVSLSGGLVVDIAELPPAGLR